MQGPFAQEHVDAWSSDFSDVESLNASTSTAILQSIRGVRRAAQDGHTDFRSDSLLVLGCAGAGKTHLFARLRRALGPKATFLLVRPEVGSDLNPRKVLAAAVDALRRQPPHHPDTQLDMLVGSALGLLRGGKARFPTTNIELLRGLSPGRRTEAISSAAAQLSTRFPEIDETWMAKFLQLPVADAATRSASLQWLSGREPDELQLQQLGLKEPLPATSVLPALNTLSVIAAHSAPLVVMFDQLENLVHGDETTARITAYATLVSELFDSVRGLVILQMALEAEWEQRIKLVLSDGQRGRLDRARHLLSLPNEKQRLELIDGWTKGLPAHERRLAPWPLSAAEWSVWGKGPGVTPRALMVACRGAYERHTGEPAAKSVEPLDTQMEELWKEQLGRAREVMRQAHAQPRCVDAAPLLGGCIGAFELLHTVVSRPKPIGKSADLRVGDPGKTVDLVLLPSDNGNSTAATLQRVLDATARTKLVAVREHERPFLSSWAKSLDLSSQLRKHPKVTWLEVTPAEVEQLLALGELLASARSKDLTGRDGNPLPEEKVREWAGRALKVMTWRLIASLLGERLLVTEPTTVAPPPAPTPPRPEASPAPKASSVQAVLQRFRLASTERLVREVRKLDPTRDQAAVSAELAKLGELVRWYGRSIVAWRGDDR